MTLRMRFCLKAATSLTDGDTSALAESIEAYVKAGIETADAETRAVNDLAAAVATERAEMASLLRQQHPALFSPDRAPLASAAPAEDLSAMFDDLMAEKAPAFEGPAIVAVPGAVSAA
ncbi:MAG: hypothetical protein RL299_1632, partial [Pseudomonadota bacterium]